VDDSDGLAIFMARAKAFGGLSSTRGISRSAFQTARCWPFASHYCRLRPVVQPANPAIGRAKVDAAMLSSKLSHICLARRSFQS
jgi:hypothetical protein